MLSGHVRYYKYLGEISVYIGSGATPKAGGNDYTTNDLEQNLFIVSIVYLGVRSWF